MLKAFHKILEGLLPFLVISNWISGISYPGYFVSEVFQSHLLIFW